MNTAHAEILNLDGKLIDRAGDVYAVEETVVIDEALRFGLEFMFGKSNRCGKGTTFRIEDLKKGIVFKPVYLINNPVKDEGALRCGDAFDFKALNTVFRLQVGYAYIRIGQRKSIDDDGVSDLFLVRFLGVTDDV